MSQVKIAVIGGGASGFFAAINIAEKHPHYQVSIFEKSAQLLQKVRISGGGRCNVTHHCFAPKALTPNYPRGQKQLYGVFKQFGPQDTINWFARRGVPLKTEQDGRMFPQSNNSETIIKCFMQEAKRLGVQICTQQGVKKMRLSAKAGSQFLLETTQGDLQFDKVVIATGSSGGFWKLLESEGYEIVPPVPSLFTFHIKDKRLQDLQGISFDQVGARVAGDKISSSGPMLITHWGLSGPAILKLSAFAARQLAEKGYEFELLIDYSGGLGYDRVKKELQNYQQEHPKRNISKHPLFGLPQRWWKRLIACADLPEDYPWEHAGKKVLNKLAEELCLGRYQVTGKSTFKEEFVTAGGIALSQVNMKTMESKQLPGLYFTGEVLDIDAVTGGFNFQACWSTAWLISESIAATQ